MLNPINNNTVKNNAFTAFANESRARQGFTRSYRYHNKDIVELSTKVNASVGAVIGTLVPLLFFAKKQNINMFKLKYGLKEMILVTTGGIIGGIIGGVIGDPTKKHTKAKINEGIFQFMNAVVPGLMVTGMLKLSDKHKQLKSIPVKTIGTATSIILGIMIAAKLSNFICDPKDKVPDRKFTMKDSIANIDDAIGALILAKFPFADKLHLEAILPVVYAWCGYRAGQTN